MATNRGLTEAIEDLSTSIEIDIDEIKSYAYNYNLLGTIQVKTVNINSELVLQTLRNLDAYIQEQISDLETDIEVQK